MNCTHLTLKQYIKLPFVKPFIGQTSIVLTSGKKKLITTFAVIALRVWWGQDISRLFFSKNCLQSKSSQHPIPSHKY